MLNLLISGDNIAKPGDLEIRYKVGSFPGETGRVGRFACICINYVYV